MKDIRQECITRHWCASLRIGRLSHKGKEPWISTRNDTAVLVTDPQNDFLSEQGVAWPLVGDSVKENHTIDHIEQIFKAAKNHGFEVFISPHYYYPTDRSWRFGVAGEKMRYEIMMFDRRSRLSLDGFSGSGADRPERDKPFIEDGQTIMSSPHKVYGPENNDLVLQLRNRYISKIILAGDGGQPLRRGPLARIVEQGFEVAVVKDATAGPRHPELGDGYASALVNFGFIASGVLTTDEVVKAMG